MLWSKVGITPPSFALVERAQKNLARVQIYAADKEVAERVHVGRSPCRRVGNEDRIEPGEPAVNGTAELPAAVIVAAGAPTLVLESVTSAGGVIYREPLLVASRRGSKVRPGLAAVERAPHVVKNVCRRLR